MLKLMETRLMEHVDSSMHMILERLLDEMPGMRGMGGGRVGSGGELGVWWDFLACDGCLVRTIVWFGRECVQEGVLLLA